MGQGFWFFNGDSQSKTENYEPLKTLTMVSMETILCQKTHFGQAFRKTLLEWTLRRITGFLLGGGGGGAQCAPLGFLEHKKPGWDQVNEAQTVFSERGGVSTFSGTCQRAVSITLCTLVCYAHCSVYLVT